MPHDKNGVTNRDLPYHPVKEIENSNFNAPLLCFATTTPYGPLRWRGCPWC